MTYTITKERIRNYLSSNKVKPLKYKIMKTAYILVAWFVIAILTINFSIDLINAANTISNIVGLFLLLTVIVVSIKTNCFLHLTKLIKPRK
jgi:Na+/alanine symporter